MSKFGAGVYILVENGYLVPGFYFWAKKDFFPPPPPPPLGNLYFFPKKQRDFRATLPTTK
jgi:hypothetical protein